MQTGLLSEKELDQNEHYYTRDTAYSGHKTVEQINSDRNIKETQDKFRYQQDTKAEDHVYDKFENQPDRCRNKFDKTEKCCANKRDGHYHANIHSFVPIPIGIKLQFILISHADNKLGQKNRAQREKAPEIICINMDTSKTEFCQAAGYFSHVKEYVLRGRAAKLQPAFCICAEMFPKAHLVVTNLNYPQNVV